MNPRGQVMFEFVISMMVITSVIVYGFQAMDQAKKELRKERLKNTRQVQK